jgi:hypothetical protein
MIEQVKWEGHTQDHSLAASGNSAIYRPGLHPSLSQALNAQSCIAL